ncbi:hypothetical protein G7Y89_g9153 [Cudoniella acicularis]|uniref:Cytochrome P450 n=1 Tax=Cudoniella acicularis TaxID=354080 RepID=A0A8H4W2V7_9HELO|nr:hypothetical protein G7Y89_g9153 [Cudoniella acicularis]
MMALAFFGPELVNNEEFCQALLDHPQDMVKSMGAFQITPKFLAPFVHAIITKGGKAMHTMLRYTTPLFSQDKTNPVLGKHCIAQSMVELNPDPSYWTPAMLAQAILGIWFAAAHQPWMNLDFITLELSRRPDYVQELLREIGDPSLLNYSDVEGLSRLDSFVKEAVRTNSLDALAIRRKALRPFTFSHGGPHVKEGELACVSLYDAMHDEGTYSNPNHFDGWRFVKTASRFTDVSEKYPVWGFGSLACPGRFHASLMIKMVLVHLISGFDFRIEDEKVATQWKWEPFTMPFESTRVQFRRRDI